MAATLRFSSLVNQSGKPYATTLWTEPRADKAFAHAMGENRVLTVFSKDVGTKKDFGKIGYHQDHSATYLIFPRPLPQNKDARVVGLNYDELAEAPVKDPVRAETYSRRRRQKTKTTSREGKTRAAVEHEFHAVLRRQASWEKSLTVRAKNKREAAEKVHEAVKAVSFDLADAEIKDHLQQLRAARTK